MKVTDLEKFVQEQVWQPYWPTHPDAPANAGLYDQHHTVRETLNELRKHPEWREQVIGRLARIGVYFPVYIVHPLVPDIEDWIYKWEKEHPKEVQA